MTDDAVKAAAECIGRLPDEPGWIIYAPDLDMYLVKALIEAIGPREHKVIITAEPVQVVHDAARAEAARYRSALEEIVAVCGWHSFSAAVVTARYIARAALDGEERT